MARRAKELDVAPNPAGDAKQLVRHRVIHHGEVFTPPSLVNDMLDLPGVADECLRIDARFLEPACGDGNFLAEVLRRRLEHINTQHPNHALVPWERDALRGLANLYGIELLHDNVQRCRDRLVDLFQTFYGDRFGDRARPAVVGAARHLVQANIHHGDALDMMTVGDAVFPKRPLVFTQWSMLTLGGGGRFKRRLFEYRELLQPDQSPAVLFGAAIGRIVADNGRPVVLAQPVGDLPLVHYLDLSNQPHPAELCC